MSPRRTLRPNEQAIVDSLRPDHQDAIATLLVRQQTIFEALQADRLATPAGTVYHYSNQKGLDGITKSGTFWLTDFTQMFDTSEMQYGFKVGMQMLREAYQNGPKTGRLRRFVKMLRQRGHRTNDEIG